MEGVWTLGIRGIHDQGMQTPPGDMPGKLKVMGEVIQDQRSLIKQHVTTKWGPVAKAFVPYKEVLPIYDAGLALPDFRAACGKSIKGMTIGIPDEYRVDGMPDAIEKRVQASTGKAMTMAPNAASLTLVMKNSSGAV